jgi:hypothetical protein
MKTMTRSTTLDRLVGPLSRCLNEQSAKRLLELHADPKLQKRVDELADRCNFGSLTAEEQVEYSRYVSFATFVGILKSKARQMLANSSGM